MLKIAKGLITPERMDQTTSSGAHTMMEDTDLPKVASWDTRLCTLVESKKVNALTEKT